MATDQSYSRQNYGNLSEPSPSLGISPANSPDTVTFYRGELDHRDLDFITDLYDVENIESPSERYELESMYAEITWYDNHGLDTTGTLEMAVDRNYKMGKIPETWQKLASHIKWAESIFQKQKKDRIILDSDAEWEKTTKDLQDAHLDIF